MSLSDAVFEGLVCPGINADERATRASVLKALGRHIDTAGVKGVTDRRTGDGISLSDAVLSGVLDMSTGKYVINPQSGQ